ncbi:hydrolase [Geobacter sp. FeAm09]|uniref:RBBP9/YdeN family alpha/beta hydrolase n=1 Tax=Geobacter sp. FeAm09 TaxID=2597769 RepID=UPI0011ED789C|nr:alpha/beta hydrolase [Geobacter sp. FeAm09]QEM68375.1 hydrolase [Geobacter sp. FeAm09]
MGTGNVTRGYLIVHGWHGSGRNHWQTWLANRLRDAGEQVRYPVLPDFHTPRLDEWLATLHTELAALDGRDERVVVCHSLAVLLWLHHAAASAAAPVDRLLLVAPPGPALCVPEVASFFPPPLDNAPLKRSAREILLVCTDNDPCCPEQAAQFYGRPLGVETVTIAPEAGHINEAAGYGPWPAVEQWCLTGTFPLI